MTLRVRLLVTSLSVAVPLVIAWSLLDARSRQTNRLEQLRSAVERDLDTGLLARCEADPPRVGRPGRGGRADTSGGRDRAERSVISADGDAPVPGDRAQDRRVRRRLESPIAYEYFAYDAAGRPGAADAPPLPTDEASRSSLWTLLVEGPSLVVTTGSSGPCASLLARIPVRPGERRSQAQTLLLVLVSVVLAVALGGAPLVGRLRRLERAVRASAASRYATDVPVDGRDEVAAVAVAFNDARITIQQHMADARASADDLRRHVSNTTHDIGTPLSSLQGTLADLERTLAVQPEAMARVHEAMRDAHYMGSLLRNLSAVVTLDARSGAEASAPIDLAVLVERVATRHAAVARAHGVMLNHATPGHAVMVTGDPTLAEQLVSNLVDNAVRYNRPGGRVAIVLDLDRGGAFELSVTDDGPGVRDEELAHLTTRWYRGENARTRRPEGSGIGLAIAAEAAARLSMRLEFSRPPDGGLQVVVRPALPVAPVS